MVLTINDNGTLRSFQVALTSDLVTKLDSPETAGTAGQILGLNSNLDPVWTTGVSVTLKTWTSADIGGGL